MSVLFAIWLQSPFFFVNYSSDSLYIGLHHIDNVCFLFFFLLSVHYPISFLSISAVTVRVLA